ncbi:MAG: NAD(P)-binding domain-containing protein [Candidatus Devosia phytovorans]|uniref:NAD(P)-binding domain-containing protein n=1 Tax=Candidatus Devosia phytovorans TaxID=3121372 RepID=A0AAJ5VXZ8_9HYPH|nr:NAD(P)-binding domain-containing protein [Devosia sp.]WEK06091.1 MAG: NAD(P)-binding domain-containing protein [Devosia sp.]
MKIAVFGTGEVGSAISTALKTLGHDVVLGSREPGKDQDGIKVVSHADAAAHGDWVVNALHGEHAMKTFPGLPLEGKLLVDIGNWQSAVDGPIDKTLGESLAAALPGTSVVKATNFVSAQLMGHPEKLKGTHTNFVAGNDAGDREKVTQLLRDFGWTDIVDLGDLSACRAMESLAPMWIRLNAKYGHVWFNFALLRQDEPQAN